ncbi:MAG TPA: hypothetical protein VHL57_09030 [Flavobacteriales bacterium]|jgi:hypothetical protein|nr:hypothetical protein [Flavobacteriales bacterium]
MHLTTVENTFMITGRGLVLVPGLGAHARNVRAGARIRLVRPDGSTMHTTIQGDSFNDGHELLIGPEVMKTDVPVGTEVWLDEMP